jgi:mRNA-degrading endonuclease RelE of RelBE toxin-antitoxin system
LNFIPFDSFERSAGPLRKKYHHFDQDFKDCLEELLPNPPLHSVAMPGYKRKLWKARLGNTDQQRGKSGGYRFIFYFDEGKPDALYGLDIYPKSQREDIPILEMLEIYKRFMLFLADRFKQQKPPLPKARKKPEDNPEKALD